MKISIETSNSKTKSALAQLLQLKICSIFAGLLKYNACLADDGNQVRNEGMGLWLL
jgi:hypothetical protein